MSEINPLYIFITIVAVAWLIGTYNGFIKYRNSIQEQWSGIDAALKRRFNLIPKLVDAVKGYAKHESELMEGMTDKRVGSDNLTERSAEESEITKGLGGLIAVAENYPDLKASQNYTVLQNALNEVEGEIQHARRLYNGAVRKYNTHVESFPSNIMAKIFRFSKADYFTLELATQREVPDLDFK